jgi:probable rRNA maturation factor
MITLTNTQRKIVVNTGLLHAAAQAMLTSLEYADFDLGILLCGKDRMRSYNAEYRHKDYPTDVLSFPFHTELKPGERIHPASPDEANLGDIILCPEIIEKKRHEWDRTFDHHCTVLIAHAIAHLLGHDHEDDEDYLRMQKLENKLLQAAGITPDIV